MVERTDWKRQVQKLDREIENYYARIPSAYWDEDIPLGTREAVEAFDAVMAQNLPTREKAMEILENKSENSYLDVLRAELTVALVKKRQLL